MRRQCTPQLAAVFAPLSLLRTYGVVVLTLNCCSSQFDYIERFEPILLKQIRQHQRFKGGTV